MLDGLEQFINLDMPFDLDTRLGNIEAVRANMDRSDVTSAEAFRQVLELYSIELQYGRGIEAYTDTIALGGIDREVDICLLYTSPSPRDLSTSRMPSSA